MIKPVTMWAVVRPDGSIQDYTVLPRRKDVLSNHPKRYWNKLRKLGYRAVKVRVEVVE